jgi:hypothetical protein
MKRAWRSRVAALVLAVLLSFGFSGCGVVVIAGLGALGGYVISPDTVEGSTGYSESELFEAAIDILDIMGTVSERSKANGQIVAKVSGAKVTISMVPQSRNATMLRVKARKGWFPKIAVAQDVYMKIVRRLQE